MKLKFWERFKGYFTDAGSARKKHHAYINEKTWTRRCEYADQMIERHGLAKAQIYTIAGQITAKGIFLEEPTEKVTGDGQPTTRAVEAKSKCEELNERIKIHTLAFNTAKNMAKYGSSFWEKSWTPIFNVRTVPMMEFLAPAEWDVTRGVSVWRQTVQGQEIARWPSEELVQFDWDVTTRSWPFGTGLLIGLDTEFETLEQLEIDIKEHMHKTAFPKELWGIGDREHAPTDTEMTGIKSKVKNWKPGQSFVTNYPVSLESGGAGNRNIEDLDSILNFLKDQLVDGLMVPPISKQYNSTEASAKVMMPWAHANLIQPMQQIIAQKIEDEVYKPYLMQLGYSVKLCPTIIWESPDAHKEENAEYYSKLVAAGVIPPRAAAKELGYETEWDEMHKEQEKKEAEQMQLAKTQPMQGGPPLPKNAQGGVVASREQVKHKHTYVIDEYE